MISIHAPAEGATHYGINTNFNNLFQSTLPRRERLSILYYVCRLQDFNPRSRGGSDSSGSTIAGTAPDFNPRSRGGSDEVFEEFINSMEYISIHAPAEGATAGLAFVNGRGAEFQSTLPRRERHVCSLQFADVQKFQSTLPRRERRMMPDGSANVIDISIHAPAEGATRAFGIQRRKNGNFNPRSRGGSDSPFTASSHL